MAIDIEQEIKCAKRIKQIEIYEFNEDIDPYDVLLDYEYAFKILQSNSETILRNHTFNYKFNYDKKSLIEGYECFRRLLSEQEEDFCSEEEYINFITEYSLKYNLNELINSASIILMYNENFNDAFYFFSLNLYINNDNFSKQYINNIEELNEFIFKYNMVLDLIRLKNYDDALRVLNEYYIKDWRTHEGDILLLILSYHQSNRSMCNKIINSINDISGNSMLFYELCSELKVRKIKPKPIIASLIVMISLICVFIYRGYITKSFNNNTANKKSPQMDSSQSLNDKDTTFNNIADNSTDLDSINSIKNSNNIPDNSIDTTNTNNTKENKAATKAVEKPIDKVSYSNSANPLDQLELYLSKNDINSFENSLKNIQVSKLNQEDKKRYDTLLLKFKPKAESYYYEKGKYFYYNSKNYNKSAKYFMDSYKYLSGIYLDQHVLFLLGQSIKNQSPIDSIKYYREYIDKYKSGCYIELALYNLSTIYYSNNNINEAKTYAEILKNDYANSKYINKTINTILQN